MTRGICCESETPVARRPAVIALAQRVSQAQVTVSHVFYHLTGLPPLAGDSYAVPGAINNAGVVAGYGGGGTAGTSALVWQGGVPVRLTAPGSQVRHSIIPLPSLILPSAPTVPGWRRRVPTQWCVSGITGTDSPEGLP